MNRPPALLALALLLATPAFGAGLSTADAAAITAVIDRNNLAAQKGDVETLVDCSSDQIVAALGGRAKYAAAIQGSMAIMKAQEVHVVSHRMEPPTEPVTAGPTLLTVVKEVTVLESHGHRVRTDGFTVAVRPAAGGPWKLIGGNGIAQNPGIMPALFPGFPADYRFPPFKNTPL